MATVEGKMRLNSGMKALTIYGEGNSKLCVESKNWQSILGRTVVRLDVAMFSSTSLLPSLGKLEGQHRV